MHVYIIFVSLAALFPKERKVLLPPHPRSESKTP